MPYHCTAIPSISPQCEHYATDPLSMSTNVLFFPTKRFTDVSGIMGPFLLKTNKQRQKITSLTHTETHTHTHTHCLYQLAECSCTICMCVNVMGVCFYKISSEIQERRIHTGKVRDKNCLWISHRAINYCSSGP